MRRYLLGKAPKWVDDGDEEGDISMARKVSLEKAFPSREDSNIMKRDAHRMHHLVENRFKNKEEIRADHRRIEIISTEEEEQRW